ncbi:hypothetical protein TIFTF001_052043 [Ficus carica]|uniref:Uncharacterized protein n=1 Tax=Ficus carica TaxID=3494 RepID=A0AA88EDJ2_FICCA|nr:hypothetical protein TIFTF001_052043 [Ficus carica]
MWWRPGAGGGPGMGWGPTGGVVIGDGGKVAGPPSPATEKIRVRKFI